jgi:hypothetical protein
MSREKRRYGGPQRIQSFEKNLNKIFRGLSMFGASLWKNRSQNQK